MEKRLADLESAREPLKALLADWDEACEQKYDEEKFAAFCGMESLRELVAKLWPSE
jgi:hypothetical protein